MTNKRDLKIALIQLYVTSDKKVNIQNATKYIQIAKDNLSDIVVLPEFFNSPLGSKNISKYAEKVPEGDTCKVLSECAKKNKIFIVGGSIPEIDGSKVFNTCTVWNSKGELLTKYRKMHLFESTTPGSEFNEFDSVSPGDSFVDFEVENVKIGIGICHDVRFPEFAQIYRMEGCNLLLYPSTFNIDTGSLYWDLVVTARAVDNQLYVAGISQAYNANAEFKSWGHSLLVNPEGVVEAATDNEESIIFGIINLNKVQEIRKNIPVSRQARSDIYELKYEYVRNLY